MGVGWKKVGAVEVVGAALVSSMAKGTSSSSSRSRSRWPRSEKLTEKRVNTNYD